MSATKDEVSKGKRVPASEMKEVQEFLDLKSEIEALRTQNPDVFMKFDDLIDRYNAALEIADKVVRTQGVSCGPFDNFSVSVDYDANKMFDELGEDLFLQCGGKVRTVPVYEIDKKQVEAAIAGKKIHEDSVGHFRSVSKKYHAPKKVVLP